MKKYINSEGKTQHFIGTVPEGYREMTADEIMQEEQAKQAKETKRLNMEAIIAQQRPYLIAKYSGAIEYFRQLYNAGDMENARAILADEQADVEIKPILDLLLVQFDK